jgi:hypothetical protein
MASNLLIFLMEKSMPSYLAIQKKNSNTDSAAGMLINPGAGGAEDILEEGGQDEWMHGADGKFVLIDDDVEDASGPLEWSPNHNWDVREDTYDGNHASVSNMESTYASMLKSESRWAWTNKRQASSTDLFLALQHAT